MRLQQVTQLGSQPSQILNLTRILNPQSLLQQQTFVTSAQLINNQAQNQGISYITQSTGGQQIRTLVSQAQTLGGQGQNPVGETAQIRIGGQTQTIPRAQLQQLQAALQRQQQQQDLQAVPIQQTNLEHRQREPINLQTQRYQIQNLQTSPQSLPQNLQQGIQSQQQNILQAQQRLQQRQSVQQLQPAAIQVQQEGIQQQQQVIRMSQPIQVQQQRLQNMSGVNMSLQAGTIQPGVRLQNTVTQQPAQSHHVPPQGQRQQVQQQQVQQQQVQQQQVQQQQVHQQQVQLPQQIPQNKQSTNLHLTVKMTFDFKVLKIYI